MQAAEITLPAAIRDATSSRNEARHKAIRNIAPALLAELDRPGPAWRATEDHPRGAEALQALQAALTQDEDAALAGVAATGLGMLGHPEVVDAVWPWLERDSDDEGASFLRECAVIAVSLAGAAAPASESRFKKDVLDRIVGLLDAERPDVRFQAAMAAVEVGGEAVERELATRLRVEEHHEVRRNLVEALARLDPPGDPTCSALAEIVADPEEGPTGIGFEAAMALASARRKEAGPRLVQALGHRWERDRALEALAALGRMAPGDAVPRVDALARGLLTPGITRVRAAYALARLVAGPKDPSNPGIALLGRLAWHPRKAVREAVADAHAALRTLEPEGS